MHRIILVSVILLVCTDLGLCNSNENLLLKNLFSKYNKLARPVNKQSDRVTVSLSYSTITLNKVDEENGAISVSGFVSMFWTDPRLKWNSTEYDGITTVNVPNNNIWTPDIKAFNGMYPAKNFPVSNFKVVISNNGSVIFVPIVVMEFPCRFNLVNYPYDKHECTLKLGAWTYSKKAVDVNLLKPPTLANFNMASPKYKLVGVSGKREELQYPCCPEIYVTILLNFKLQRIFALNSMTNVLVGIMLSLLSFVQIVIPVDCKQKCSISGVLIVLNFLLLSFNVFMLPQVGILVPLLIMYMASVTVLSGVYFAFCILVTSVAAMGRQRKKPNVLINFINTNLAKILMMTKNDSEDDEEDTELEVKNETKSDGKCSKRGQRRRKQCGWFMAARVLDRLFSWTYIVLSVLVVILLFGL